MTGDDLIVYLRAFLAAQSIDALREDIDRWPGFLAAEGVTTIPPVIPRTDEEVRAGKLIGLLVHQATADRHPAIAHPLRDELGIRRSHRAITK